MTKTHDTLTRHHWKDLLPEHLLPEHLKSSDILFGREDAEERFYTDPEQAACAALDDAYDPAQPELPMDWTFEAHAHRRKKLGEGWVDTRASMLTERWREEWGEEYGSPDGDDDDAGAEEEEMRVLLRAWAARSIPWQCDPTGDVIVYDVEWVRKQYPDVHIANEEKKT